MPVIHCNVKTEMHTLAFNLCALFHDFPLYGAIFQNHDEQNNVPDRFI